MFAKHAPSHPKPIFDGQGSSFLPKSQGAIVKRERTGNAAAGRRVSGTPGIGRDY